MECWIRIRKKHLYGEQDPYPYQSEKLEAVDGIFGAQEGPNLGESEWPDPDPEPDLHLSKT